MLEMEKKLTEICLPKVIKLETRKVGEAEAQEIKESIDVPRSFTISRADLEKYGYTSGCSGCTSLIKGSSRQAHTTKCRERMREEMASEPKVIEAREREMTFHEKVYEDMRAKVSKKGEDEVKSSSGDFEKEHPQEPSSSSGVIRSEAVRSREEEGEHDNIHDRLSKRRKFLKEANEEANQTSVKRIREDQREREEVEKECDEDLDSDGDLELGWVEFAMNIDGVDMVMDINVEDNFNKEIDSEFTEAFDDITGLKLDVGKLKGARNEEIKYIETRGIWEVVPVSKCWDHLGKGPTSGRGLTSKRGTGSEAGTWGGTLSPKGRGPRRRYSPLCLRWRQRNLVQHGRVPRKDQRRKKKLLFIDVKKAHMNAVCKEWAFVELPEEVHVDGYCAQLKYWLYGMRPAARAWEKNTPKAGR